MCAECDAAKCRRDAATALLERLEGPTGYGIAPALKQLYKPEPLTDEWVLLARRFNFE